jgi:hypothetical protein
MLVSLASIVLAQSQQTASTLRFCRFNGVANEWVSLNVSSGRFSLPELANTGTTVSQDLTLESYARGSSTEISIAARPGGVIHQVLITRVSSAPIEVDVSTPGNVAGLAEIVLAEDSSCFVISFSSSKGHIGSQVWKVTEGVAKKLYETTSRVVCLGADGGIASDKAGHTTTFFFASRRLKSLYEGKASALDQVFLSRAKASLGRAQRNGRSNNIHPSRAGSSASSFSVSPSGHTVFEQDFFIYSMSGRQSYDTLVTGDVLMSRAGIVWNWKSEQGRFRGGYFRDDSHFIFFRDTPFSMGKVNLTRYQQGIYEINLKTLKVKSIELRKDLLKRLVRDNFELVK